MGNAYLNQDMLHLGHHNDRGVSDSGEHGEPSGSHVNRLRQMHQQRGSSELKSPGDNRYGEEYGEEDEEILGDEHEYDVEDDELFYDPAEEEGSGNSNQYVHESSEQNVNFGKQGGMQKKMYNNFF